MELGMPSDLRVEAHRCLGWYKNITKDDHKGWEETFHHENFKKVMMYRNLYHKGEIDYMNNQNYLQMENSATRDKLLESGVNIYSDHDRNEGPRNLSMKNSVEKSQKIDFGSNRKAEAEKQKFPAEGITFTKASNLNKMESAYELYNIDSDKTRSYENSGKSLTRALTNNSDYMKYIMSKSPMRDFSTVKDQDIHKARPGMTRSLSYTADRQTSGSGQIRDLRVHSYSPSQNDCMMAADREDGAINLSAEAKHMSGELGTSAASAPSPDSSGENDSQGLPSPQANTKLSGVPITSGLSKRKSRPPSQCQSGRASPSINGTQPHQSVLMLAAQQGLSPQQVQQMLTVSQQPALIPPNLQHIMQAQQTAVMQQQQKAQEQALIQLNEQLQLNILQQTQLLQDKKINGKQTQQQLQQLGIQQQQLIQQIQQLQLQQRQFLLACLMQQPFSAQQGVISPAEMHQIWKDIASSQVTGAEDGQKATTNGIGLGTMNGLGLPSGNPLLPGPVLGMNGLTHEAFPFAGALIGQPQISVKQEDGYNPLFRHSLCKWPGCDTECKDVTDFTKHLNTEHTLDDKNTAQARVQMQIVSQLEIQLSREKELLHAMMQHLHLRPHRDREEKEIESKVSEKILSSPKLSAGSLSIKSEPVPKMVKPPHSLQHLTTSGAGLTPLYIPPPQSSLTSIPSQPSTPLQTSSQPATPTSLGPMRRRVSDKCNLPISAEIQRNREFYRTTDVRPPFTYASLIRQAIIESENKQLTLNEVYQWFQNTFAYFRRNEATWKNAVRHNLSLHKCFMRVENVKGAVWTVDEHEFYKRRPQKLTGAIPGSPSMTSDSGLYGDSINASLRQVAMFMSQAASSGSMSDSMGAEDLSMKSHSNSNDSFIKSESLERDEMMFLKREAAYQEDVVNGNSIQDYSNSQTLDLSPHGNRRLSPLNSQISPTNHLSPVALNSPQSKLYAPDTSHSDRLEGHSDDTASVYGKEHYKFLSVKLETKPEESDMQVREDNVSMEQSQELNGEVRTDSESNMETEKSKTGTEENYTESSEKGKRREDLHKYSADEEMRKSSGTSPQYSPKVLGEQILTNQEVYAPFLHTGNMAVVSHSMT